VQEQSLNNPSLAAVPGEPVKNVSLKPRWLRQPTVEKLGAKQCCWGCGRRKSAIARVRLRPGSGKITINERELENYFANLKDRNSVCAPLALANCRDKYDVFIKLSGGGIAGQAGAAMLGVARALVAADPGTFDSLRHSGYLTRDSRMVERKKYGQKKARKSFQFSKR